MSGTTRCPDCGSCEIVEDAHYSQEQLVCADCGFILTEGALTTTLTEEGFQQAVNFTVGTGQNESISRTKLRGIVRVRNLCRVLRLPDTFADTAVSYYESAFYLPLCHSARKEKKEAIMGCCVYITCRQHGWPLTIATISLLLYSKYELVTSVFLELVQALKVDVPSMSLKALAKSHCQSFRLFRTCPSAPEGYAEDLDKVLERTLQILELASETWLVTGRRPIPIITAAVYLSWQSLKPAQRLSCTLSRFCKLSETELPSPAVLRLKELKERCLKLSTQLPWLKMQTLNNKTVVYHLGDILKHQAYLLRKALEAVEMSTTQSEEGSSLAQQPAGAAFLPPCVTKPRKRPYTTAFPDKLQNITGDEDISDSEIEQYLRTPDEVACFQQLQAQLDARQ
ncbi:transcription factor IIIB 50 kDa subunit [Bufo gargarizans]|uniref:transcription factor IIIB 50 kDa subunit n=1 Tax=Bufo gargarizans TaxID=30331 RepID=UPI001CF14A36|nr:transcription factor IIIB 50 kDa subunit [Bufo gargarizans]